MVNGMSEKPIKLIDAYRDACFKVAKGEALPTVAIIARNKLEEYIVSYKRSLEGLTPGGSEFVDDPKFCAEFIRNRMNHLSESMKKMVVDNKKKE